MVGFYSVDSHCGFIWSPSYELKAGGVLWFIWFCFHYIVPHYGGILIVRSEPDENKLND